jgi:hypothetical protein
MDIWRTYTPDGRMLEVEHTAGEWTARCGGRRAVAATALEALSEAVGSDRTAIGSSGSGVATWLSAQAAKLEDEAAR